MKARRLEITRHGGPEVFAPREIDLPPPGEGQARVAVRAVGVNLADLFCRLGLYAAAPPVPFAPGFEFAGAVESTGPGVDEFRAGDEVMGVVRFGAYSSALVAGTRWLRKLPPGWSMEQGAAFPVAAMTAWYGLFHLGRLAAGETVVITAAAGGVGGAACRLASGRGARVIGAVGSEGKRAAASAAGADRVLVSRGYRIWDEIRRLRPEGIDLVFDAVAGRGLARAFRCLRPEGRLVIYGFAGMTPARGWRPWPLLAWRALRQPRFHPFQLVGGNRSVAGFNLVHLWHREELFADAVSEMLAGDGAERLRPVIGARLPLDRAGEAQALLASRGTTGKVVLLVD